jgi:hypothetical protein
MNVVKHPCICIEWIWEPFYVGLGPQPVHPYIICSQADPRFLLTPKFWANKYGSCGMMVDTSAHPLHLKRAKHLVYVWSGCGNHSMWVWGPNAPLHHL